MPLVPAVGVVITNFNNEAFVGAAIESVARQSIRDIRVIVVDDASTDRSDDAIREVLSRIADLRFRYIRLDTNLGQAGAIRRGLADLDAPFVCFLDSDDYWYPAFLARHLAAHLNADFPVALSFCDSHIIDSNGSLLAGTAWWFDYNEADPAHRLIGSAAIPDIKPGSGEVTYTVGRPMILRTTWSLDSSTNSMASMMLRRDFVDLVLVPPDRRLRLYVDFYLSTFAGLLTGVVAIHDALYAYRIHGENRHSNGALLGGRYSSSKADWAVIRKEILGVVDDVLRSQAQPIRQAFGDYRYTLAETQIGKALDPRTWIVKFGDRLRQFFQ